RQAAGKTFNFVEAGDHQVASFLELGAHRLDRRLRPMERLDAGHLRETGGAGVRVSHQASDVRRQVDAHYAVAYTPARHGVGLRKTVEQNAALLHAIDRHDGVMLTFEDEATVDLVGQHHDVAIADNARDAGDVLLRQHATGRVMRRIHDDEFRAIVDQPAELIDIKPEIHFFAQPNRYGFRAKIIDH